MARKAKIEQPKVKEIGGSVCASVESGVGKFLVVVHCNTKEQQQELIEKLEKEFFICFAVSG